MHTPGISTDAPLPAERTPDTPAVVGSSNKNDSFPEVSESVNLDNQDKYQGPRFNALSSEERKLLLRLLKTWGTHRASAVTSAAQPRVSEPHDPRVT